MRMVWLFRLVVVGVVCAGMSAAGVAQTGGSGVVLGTVTAADGSPIAGAAVTLSTADGQTRIATSAADGTFVLRDLASGVYSIRTTAQGFGPDEESSVVVAQGRSTHLEIHLAVASAQQTVNVSAAPITFDVSQTSSVVNVDRDRVEELPIPNRNYLTFVLLSPQVMPANPALGQQSAVAAGGAYSFGGLRPGSNAVYLDGVGDNDEFTGSSRTELSPEAINDFQIVNHGFAASSGGGAGGSIDVQTRAGTDKVHGDAFMFVQNGALNGTPDLGLYPRKPDESRARAGIALGGPIQKGRMFYYGAAEQELARGEDANDLKPATLNAINTALHLGGPLSSTTLQTGFFPTTEQETELSGRLDRTLTANESVMLRYALTNARNVNEAFHTDELADLSARGSSFTADNSINGTLTSTLQHDRVNQFSFELAQRRAVERTGSTAGPGVLIPGTALFGTPWSGNRRRFETHIEFSDVFTWTRGHHLLSAGARADWIPMRTATPDGTQGFFVFPTLAALEAGTPDVYAQTFAAGVNLNFLEARADVYGQDHWTVSPKVTLDYGLRYEANHLPTELGEDALNLSPRLGAAVTPWKSTVMRAGFGIFYDRFQLATVNKILRSEHGFDEMVEDADAAAVYHRTTVPQGPGQLGGVPTIWRGQSRLRNPYSEVGSLSVEQALPMQTTLSAEYQYVHGVRLGRTVNMNLQAPVVLTSANASALGFTSPTAQQLGRPVFGPGRIDSRSDAINEFQTEANSSYHGGTVTLNRQFTDDFEVLAGYTFSKTIDNASSDTEQPQNPYALRDERALSLNDQRNRLTLSGLWIIGPDLGDAADAAANEHPGPLMKAFAGFEIAPILTVASGFRANPVTGDDAAHEHVFPVVSRPLGLARNSLQTKTQVNFDLRVLRMIAIGPGHLDVVAESFNLLNHPNEQLLNTAFGQGAVAQPGFGSRIETGSPRRIQFSLDYEF